MESHQVQNSNLTWIDGVPVSNRFDDPYFSTNDGLAETRHVFIAGNDLPKRFCAGFHIAELGFGTGLNLLAAWQAWEAAGHKTPLRFTSFEAYPLAVQEMRKALSLWPELEKQSNRFLAALKQSGTITLPTLHFSLITGDANKTLPNWASKADAWFLDGFSPSKNPELWSADLLAEVGRHTAAGGTCATYSAAGHVRQKLAAAGFKVARVKGHGNKRHMTIGRIGHAE